MRFGRSISLIGALAAAPAAVILRAQAAGQVAQAVIASQPSRRQVRYSVEPRYRRGKNPPTKRRLRANRLHISRRTRRRHRRARRAA